jgi:hypothetical protein
MTLPSRRTSSLGPSRLSIRSSFSPLHLSLPFSTTNLSDKTKWRTKFTTVPLALIWVSHHSRYYYHLDIGCSRLFEMFFAVRRQAFSLLLFTDVLKTKTSKSKSHLQEATQLSIHQQHSRNSNNPANITLPQVLPTPVLLPTRVPMSRSSPTSRVLSPPLLSFPSLRRSV